MSMQTGAGKTEHFFVWGGIASVNHRQCNIVTEYLYCFG
ncbi:MAG: hypothetical protein H6925_00815 [Holosporaceae bacterium]|nr:MAG: hypothetical protein H6925_00815 [Holosporaceae bacterium]